MEKEEDVTENGGVHAHVEGRYDLIPAEALRVIALDTGARFKGGPPYMVSASSCEAAAGCCYVDDHNALRHIRDHVRGPGVLTLLHNVLYDLPQLAKSGIFLARWIDTGVCVNTNVKSVLHQGTCPHLMEWKGICQYAKDVGRMWM